MALCLNKQGRAISQKMSALGRCKGQADKALLEAGFPSVYIFRPAYIYPVIKTTSPRPLPLAGSNLTLEGVCGRVAQTGYFGCIYRYVGHDSRLFLSSPLCRFIDWTQNLRT
jgi:hypothetical protein